MRELEVPRLQLTLMCCAALGVSLAGTSCVPVMVAAAISDRNSDSRDKLQDANAAAINRDVLLANAKGLTDEQCIAFLRSTTAVLEAGEIPCDEPAPRSLCVVRERLPDEGWARSFPKRLPKIEGHSAHPIRLREVKDRKGNVYRQDFVVDGKQVIDVATWQSRGDYHARLACVTHEPQP